MKNLSFDEVLQNLKIEPYSERFTFQGSGYEVREATAEAVVAYREKIFSGVSRGKDENQVTNLSGLPVSQCLLVSKCVFEVSNGQPLATSVPMQTVMKWPERVVKSLYDWIKRVSGLANEDDDDDDDKKKSKALDDAKN